MVRMRGFLIKVIRPALQVIIVITIVAVFLYAQRTYKTEQLFFLRLTEIYGILAVIYLYITLIISPFYAIFSDYPFATLLRLAKRPIGQGAFVFALIHATIGFFKQLAGFKGVFFLSGSDLISFFAGLGALLILTILGITSADWAVRLLGGKEWKLLHRFTYVAGVLVVLHMFLFGSHFDNLSLWPSKVALVAVCYLLLLEALRIIKWLKLKRLKKEKEPTKV